VLGAILLSLKHAFRLFTRMRVTRCAPEVSGLPGAYGSIVGLVSLGAVSQRLCELLRLFDVRVIAYDPFLSSARADVVSLHTPLTPATEGLVKGRHFRQMKNGATFINTARGAIVNEGELIAVLRSRPDLQVILDVTHPEPPTANSALYDLPNVFLTPHIAGSLGPERLRLGQCMLEELDRYVAGQPLLWEITRDRALLMA
jgi:phosphoglycerate dehydrogenase-like enzyme